MAYIAAICTISSLSEPKTKYVTPIWNPYIKLAIYIDNKA